MPHHLESEINGMKLKTYVKFRNTMYFAFQF